MAITPYDSFHEKQLGGLIFRFLSKRDRDGLELADKTWCMARVLFEEPAYEDLKNCIENKQAVFLRDSSGLHQEMLLAVLGSGGSKTAMELPQTLIATF